MEKTQLLKEIMDSYTEEDWALLENRNSSVPVNESNRKLLLGLKGKRMRLKGSVPDEDVQRLKDEVSAFLKECWAEQPLAHKYVIDSCLVLTFLYEKPMHPWESVKYYSVVRDGKAEYYCPHKTDSVICGFCRSHFCEDLYAGWDTAAEEMREKYGERSGYIKRALLEAGFLESGIIETSELLYHDEVREQCEKNLCGAYGTTWACPPAVGTLKECRERVERYSRMQLFSKAYAVQDTASLEEMRDCMSNFKLCAGELDKKLKGKIGGYLMLSNESCGRCKKCTYPDAPCRFPDELKHSLESYGYNVLELSRKAGLKYINGQKTFTFFGAVIYDEE